jgi:hypothetical protein
MCGHGDTVVVCDRATPIARIGPMTDSNETAIREPCQPIKSLASARRIKLRRKVDVEKVLLQMREER